MAETNNLRLLVEQKDVCSLPWVHLELNLHNDRVQPCCKWEGSIGRISEGALDLWQGPKFSQLRQQHLSGLPPPECRACQGSPEEFSYKTWKNQLYKSLLNVTIKPEPAKPRVLHLGLKNTCQLACVMCSPGLSSRLDQLVRSNPELTQWHTPTDHHRKQSLDHVISLIGDLDHVTIAGGEPTIDPDCMTIIKAIDHLNQKSCTVNVSTNLDRINPELMDLMNQRGDHLSVSVDAVGLANDWIRWPSKWSRLEANLNLILDRWPRIGLRMNTTISCLTVTTMNELIAWSQQWPFLGVMASPVLNMPPLDAANLPQKIKESLLRELKGNDPLTQASRARIMLPSTQAWQLSVDYFRALDRARMTNWSEAFPLLRTS